MAITQIRGAQVLDATITEDDLNTSVAGNGISGGGGAALALDLSELSAAAVDVANDSFALLDAGDSSSKVESVADLMTAVAGAGLAATSGVLSVNVTDGIAISGDDVILASSAAGDGLSYTAGVLAVRVDGTTIEITADVLNVVAGGIGTTELASLSVTNAKIGLGAVDVDNLSDFRVTEGTGLVADVAAGNLTTDDGTTVTAVGPISAGTTTVADDDISFVEVDSAGTVSNNTVGFTQGSLPLAEVTAATGDITVVTDKRAWLDIDLGQTGLVEANFVDNEVPVGDLDGADVTYTLDNTPSPPGSLRVYLNGIRQDEGASDDYTLTTATITFAAAPVSTDKILVDYRKA